MHGGKKRKKSQPLNHICVQHSDEHFPTLSCPPVVFQLYVLAILFSAPQCKQVTQLEVLTARHRQGVIATVQLSPPQCTLPAPSFHSTVTVCVKAAAAAAFHQADLDFPFSASPVNNDALIPTTTTTSPR